jgi:hypothetical protein
MLPFSIRISHWEKEHKSIRMVALIIDQNIKAGVDVCSSGCEKCQGSRVFVDLELIVLI